MPKPIDDRNEHLSVTNFLSIKNANLSLLNISAIIGPQASGKSILAKLFYYGRKYISDFVASAFLEDFELRNFKKTLVADFLSLFGGLDGFDDPFEIHYHIGTLSITISRGSKAGKIKLSHNKEITDIVASLRREYGRYLRLNADDDASFRRRASQYDFRRSTEELTEFFDSVPQVLFVPASRSFYAAVSEELFTFLASDERVDPLTSQFGSFYEFAKRRLSGDPIFSSKIQEQSKLALKKTEPVIYGKYVREKSQDYILTDWGRVQLTSASSGQQEALPLLFSLLEYPTRRNTSQLLIIEEPEAHLFPDAQKYILDLIVEVATENTCDVLFTTHSPYVLACLNTHILKLENEAVPNTRNVKIGAYLTSGGLVEYIVDDENLIDTNALDSISEKIANEFIQEIQ